jgi:hypothetical protein
MSEIRSVQEGSSPSIRPPPKKEFAERAKLAGVSFI